MVVKTQTTLEDLYHVPENGKAEIVDGELVIMSPTGHLPNRAAGAIFFSLKMIERQLGGWAYTDNVGFIVNLPRRTSFSPDVAFYIGKSTGMRFLQGAPVFAVEVLSEGDYTIRAQKALARKRTDYFTAGTLVVWEVDLLSQEKIKCYRTTDPDHPTIFRRGDVADAEPAVPGWRFPVNNLFDE